MTKISAVLMVRNESENLPRCLSALNKLAAFDEIVVLDTGSTDDTVEVARAHGARVVIPEDIDGLFIDTEFGRALNFSKARNLSIDQATGDWLYLLDADEETVGDASDLRAFIARLRPERDCMGIRFEDYKGGRNFMKFIPPRFFKRGVVRFVNVVHNRATGYREPIEYYPGIKIKHTGYDLTPEQEEAKKRRTLGLLRWQLAQDPAGSEWCYFYTAGIYANLGELDRAIEDSIKYIEAKDRVHRFNPSIYYILCQACLKSKNVEAADKWIGEAIRAVPDDMDVAAAICDWGAWQNKPHVLAAGCEMYLRAWAELDADQTKAARFVYNYNKETLSRVLFHISCLRLNQGMMHLRRLRSLYPEIDPKIPAIMERDLLKQHKIIGVRPDGIGGDVVRFADLKVVGGKKERKNRGKKRGWVGGKFRSGKV